MEDLSFEDITFFEESQHSNPLVLDYFVANIVHESDSHINIDDSVPNVVDESIPTVGMCFDTTDDVKSFY